ncbi:phosphopantetheine-binding protein [Kibdelosporangium aridum]|uniref:Acyl carrier protein n=1 Tax=Kibdelosporangium aridum TaxID=2030 RepID=A0A1Y5Y2U4_KIBAR|nr:phosphopantetheine-binding protein [Kibdelosporangium aridum]SMD22914.1 acyl carrier protein [Kibdelosporangium aridum]
MSPPQSRITEIVCHVLEIDEDEITESSRFVEDHDADSLRSIEIVSLLEHEFDIVIDQANLSRMVNLAGVRSVLAETPGFPG